jgi:putative DNA primase/helicase
MLDTAKIIVDFWRKHNLHVVVEETGEILIYRNGIYIPFTDTQIKNQIIEYLEEPTEIEAIDKEFLDIKFSTSLFNQVKNRLHYHILKLKDFDKWPWRVQCLNGWVDLRSGYFTEYVEFNENPYPSRIQIPIMYDKDAKCKEINKFIVSVFGVERLSFIYEIISYLLYRSNKFQKAFIFFGEASSGKTTFIEMIRKFLGENNIQDISIQKINKQYQMAQLKDKLANIYDDLPIKKLNYIMNFKQVVTNKTLTGELKFVQKLVTWNNFCKQLYTCNVLPEVGDDTGDDFWRRIILIHCTNHFDNGTKDFDIGDKISTREEFSGLLNLCISNFRALHGRGNFLEKFDNIDTVKGIWQINVNPMKLFLEECCLVSYQEEDFEEADFFRAQLNAFRKSKNAEPISMNMITRRLKDLGVEKKQKGNGKRYYIGIKIVEKISGVVNMDRILVGKEVILDDF